MARLARIVVPGRPHHLTQRGNRRLDVFFGDADFRHYRDVLAQSCTHYGIDIWAYCLMPNHVHLIAVPATEMALAQGLGEAHRRYARFVNQREDWKGHLWQERFASFPMDDRHLIAAARYIEFNPVRAGLSKRPEDYPWSSAQAHLTGRDDSLVKAAPLLAAVGDWAAFLDAGLDEAALQILRAHVRTGRPLGSGLFVKNLEKRFGRSLTPQKRGRKPKVTTPPDLDETELVKRSHD